MSRQAFSCAVLLLVVTLSSKAADTKPDPAATSDSWAPLAPAATPAAAPASLKAPTAEQAAMMKAEQKKRTVALNQPEGYHDVKLKDGGVIRVADQGKSTVTSHPDDGTYDPSNYDFSRTSSYAHKDFATGGTSPSKGFFGGDKKSYTTSAYNASSYDNGDHTFQTSAYRGTKADDEFAKSYALPNPADYNKSFATKSSDLQSKTSTITTTSAPTDPLAKPWSEGDKRFYDPIVLHVPHHKFQLSSSIRNDPNSDTITDIPNRPLSVDEVRNLINNGQVPDTNSKPDAPSRALNDPNWEPPLKLPEISNRAAPATPPPDEARENELPSPGMMAQPQSRK